MATVGKVKRAANENGSLGGKGSVVGGSPTKGRKRAALGNITNHFVAGRNHGCPSSAVKGKMREVVAKAPAIKKASVPHTRDSSLHRNSSVSVASISVRSIPVADQKGPACSSRNGLSTATIMDIVVPSRNDSSPDDSVRGSISMDESMSSWDSIKSPDFEYVDNADSMALASLERRATANLHISDDSSEEYTRKRNTKLNLEADDCVVDIDNNHEDPQMCSTLAFDVYNHLLESETRKRPSANFIEEVQKDINASMRSILVDWLVEVAEEYRLVPDTLYLTVNYIDRYLSGNEINRQRLQLLGVSCMLIASKYEEICAPQVEEFCYITDNTYFREEVLDMEAAVLKYLKFEMSATTTKCFLRRFVRAAQCVDEAPSMQFEFLACYITELTLLEYSFLSYKPSLIAASAIFLTKYMLHPGKRPWNATMVRYTLYRPSQLYECVKALHLLVRSSLGSNSSLPAIREKYSQHKYKFVAKKYCPPSIPQEFFQDASKLFNVSE